MLTEGLRTHIKVNTTTKTTNIMTTILANFTIITSASTMEEE